MRTFLIRARTVSPRTLGRSARVPEPPTCFDSSQQPGTGIERPMNGKRKALTRRKVIAYYPFWNDEDRRIAGAGPGHVPVCA